MSKWQERWSNSETGQVAHESFPRVDTWRLQDDFYMNQVQTGHGAFGDHQARFFQKNPTCFCVTGESNDQPLAVCMRPLEVYAGKVLPRDFQTRTPCNLCLV